MSWPKGFLPPADVRAYRRAHRAAKTIGQHKALDEIERCHRKFGQATPSVEGMAKRCRMSERTVIRATRALEDAKCMTIDRDHPYCDGTQWRKARTNRYRIRHAPRNPWWHRGDTDGMSIAPSGCNSTAPRTVDPVDNPPDGRAPPDERPWHPSLDGKSWRDLVVRDG